MSHRQIMHDELANALADVADRNGSNLVMCERSGELGIWQFVIHFRGAPAFCSGAFRDDMTGVHPRLLALGVAYEFERYLLGVKAAEKAEREGKSDD